MKNQNTSKIIIKNTMCRCMFNYAEVDHSSNVCKNKVDMLSDSRKVGNLIKTRARENNDVDLEYHHVNALLVELYLLKSLLLFTIATRSEHNRKIKIHKRIFDYSNRFNVKN